MLENRTQQCVTIEGEHGALRKLLRISFLFVLKVVQLKLWIKFLIAIGKLFEKSNQNKNEYVKLSQPFVYSCVDKFCVGFVLFCSSDNTLILHKMYVDKYLITHLLNLKYETRRQTKVKFTSHAHISDTTPGCVTNRSSLWKLNLKNKTLFDDTRTCLCVCAFTFICLVGITYITWQSEPLKLKYVNPSSISKLFFWLLQKW